MVKVAVLFTAGTNCDEETILAFTKAGAKTERLYLNSLKKNHLILKKYQILVIPGGFTYGDYISAGKILANELQYLLSDTLMTFIGEGKLLIGICNGFQVLVKAGILPQVESQQVVTLTTNDSNRFECRWVYLKTNEASPCVFSKGLSIFPIPVAHAEGKFIVRNKTILYKLKNHHQIVFTYTNPQNGMAKYPDNPNGSIENIAGICDPTGRILGLMPHPERASFFYQYPTHYRLKYNEPLAFKIFSNAVEYAQKNLS